VAGEFVGMEMILLRTGIIEVTAGALVVHLGIFDARLHPGDCHFTYTDKFLAPYILGSHF
jgi:hypothetical protein